MDVDIDFKTDFDPIKCFDNAIRASRVQDDELKPHNAGVYFQEIPVDKITNLSAIPYQEAERLGYFKIDMLHLSILDEFESKSEIRALLKKEPDWCLLQSPSIMNKLFQLSNHPDVLEKIKPKSVIELADCIALIRPGKRYLLQYYLKDRIATRKALYQKPKNGAAYFKKPHAIAYALTIVLQLHLISAGII